MANVVSIQVALSYIRRLSGTDHYPFHSEGESRLAEILCESCESVEHAQATVDEFDGDACPSVGALRTKAGALAERCKCGRPLWAHARQNLGHRFLTMTEEEELIHDANEANKKAMANLRDSVPMIEGAPPVVCLKIQCLRNLVKTGRSDYEPEYERDFPVALGHLRAGFDPDPKYVETRMRELYPHVFSNLIL